MRVAVCSDEPYPVHDVLVAELQKRGHEVVPVGSLLDAADWPWAPVAEAAALMVASGECEEGIFCCFTGTGICMAANKVTGVRAALCCDATTAALARTWNHANVLCLSNRTLSAHVAREILAAWLDGPRGDRGTEGVELLRAVELRQKHA